MKILEVKTLAHPEVKVIRYARFRDERGYFTEHYRKSDFFAHPDMQFIQGYEFVQTNESSSQKGTIRGLHTQWNPFQGKLVRTVRGRMIDLVLDIRKNSANFGKIIAYDMPSAPEQDFGEWIWIPPGFAHGNVYPEDGAIEYFCTGEYSPGNEAGIFPLAQDIDWSLCEAPLKEVFDSYARDNPPMSPKDKQGLTVEQWRNDPRADIFLNW
ncbi:dTDP-4-keto-6-deoxy-D-glucose epimerase [Candidatus Roizmanbacteria bacterium]|nr:dTDP-4-keto-6-deoxy-D-glucose epimerase [Candidatus Roizmanbacteria bacterium]